jgi:threonine/homoserine/homoserine lactone efflux protein
MQFAGHQSEALLLGVFQVSILHNIVHLLYGVAGLALARTAPSARQYLLWGGVVYLVLWLYGMFVGHDSPANFVPLNSADNWLHLGLGVTMVALSFLPRRDRTEAYPSTAGRP